MMLSDMGKRKHINLTENERIELEHLIKAGQHAARVIGRARTLLLLDRSQGQTNTIAEVMNGAMVSQGTIANLKKRYFAGGLSRALYEQPRSGRPVTKMTGDVEAQLIAQVCSDPPEGYARRTLRLLADRLVALEIVDSISHTAIAKKLKKMNLNLGE
jgi:transposase